MTGRFALFLGTLLSAALLQADTLPAPGYYININYYANSTASFNHFYQPGNYHVSTGLVKVTAGPAPNNQVSASSAPNTGVQTSAYTQYTFEVAGPSSANAIPISIQAAVGARASAGPGLNLGVAYVDVNAAHWTGMGVSCSPTCYDYVNYSSAGSSNTLTRTLQTTAFANTWYTVDLYAAANSYAGGLSSAFADPYLFVDPSFTGAANYSVLVSPGIGNAPLSAVPEPGSFALLLAATASALSISRCKRRA